MTAPYHRRIVVLGTTGAGKTVLARQLSATLSLPYVELDALRWDANWTDAGDEVFRARVADAVSGDGWGVDGNYSVARDLVWPRATGVVWLDYHLAVIMWRLFWRTVRRAFTREELWNGNRERFRDHFLSKDSLFLWALQTYERRRKTFPVEFKKPEHSHLEVVHLRSPRETRLWLRRATQVSPPPAERAPTKDG